MMNKNNDEYETGKLNFGTSPQNSKTDKTAVTRLLL